MVSNRRAPATPDLLPNPPCHNPVPECPGGHRNHAPPPHLAALEIAHPWPRSLSPDREPHYPRRFNRLVGVASQSNRQGGVGGASQSRKAPAGAHHGVKNPHHRGTVSFPRPRKNPPGCFGTRAKPRRRGGAPHLGGANCQPYPVWTRWRPRAVMARQHPPTIRARPPPWNRRRRKVSPGLPELTCTRVVRDPPSHELTRRVDRRGGLSRSGRQGGARQALRPTKAPPGPAHGPIHKG
jgi:hypothetical protein